MKTIPSQASPALLVAHDPDGSWMIGDGVGDPNDPNACMATRIWHVVGRDASLEKLAAMAPGSQASRANATDPWTISAFSYEA